MGLTVETKDFMFSLNTNETCAIDLFIINNLKVDLVKHRIVWLTKKDMIKLIEFVKENQEKYNVSDRVLDNFISMEMLMQGKEKAQFRYY